MLRRRTLQVVADTPWTPLILTEFEIGQAMAAIEGVARLDKPLAEVGTRVALEADVERDLLACIRSAGEIDRVLPWIRRVGEHVRFGFYAEPWALDALDFLDRADLQPSDRHWISGLLFGYRASAIQRFMSRSKIQPTAHLHAKHSGNRSSLRTGT